MKTLKEQYLDVVDRIHLNSKNKGTSKEADMQLRKDYELKEQLEKALKGGE